MCDSISLLKHNTRLGHDEEWGYYRVPRPDLLSNDLAEMDDAELFEALMKMDEAGYVMGCSSRKDYHGVIGGHAYCVLQVRGGHKTISPVCMPHTKSKSRE